ncbi:MAG: hypothetical protein HY681_06075 [Chloroflexi bacterium]|nr:hypothetical protein [Chloroflexota bacterium]
MVRRTVKAQDTGKSLINDVAGLGIPVVNPAEVLGYLGKHPDLVPVVGRMAQEVESALPDAAIRLELVRDPEDSKMETLVLYLQPRVVDSTFFDRLEVWNERVAEALRFSEGWFLVNLDLRSHNLGAGIKDV